MPTISVITSALPSGSEWLSAAWGSLAAQTVPAGWRWEWILQIDGPDELRSAVPQGDSRVRTERNPRNFGAATSRTLALGRSEGELISVLDADDLMLPGHLARSISAIESYGVGWTASSTLDLQPDGSVRPSHTDTRSTGPVPDGEFYAYWLAHGIPPVWPATLVARRDLVLSVGGWMALPMCADVGLLLAMEAVAAGYFIAEPGQLYRKWPEQITASALSRDGKQRELRNQVIDARVQELRKWGVRWSGA